MVRQEKITTISTCIKIGDNMVNSELYETYKLRVKYHIPMRMFKEIGGEPNPHGLRTSQMLTQNVMPEK